MSYKDARISSDDKDKVNSFSLFVKCRLSGRESGTSANSTEERRVKRAMPAVVDPKDDTPGTSQNFLKRNIRMAEGRSLFVFNFIRAKERLFLG